MKSLLPLQPPVSAEPGPARVRSLDLDDAQTDAIFDALSSGTSRRILSLLYEEPRPARDLADETGTTVQNVRYHLEKLTDANLVTVADTWYSEKGKEMRVYAPADEAVVLVAGEPTLRSRLTSVISRALGAVALFAAGGVVVQRLAERYRPAPRAGVPESTIAVSESPPSPTLAETIASILVEPGTIFFLGCVLATLVVTLFVWYAGDRRSPTDLE